jgi:hypothetical protein
MSQFGGGSGFMGLVGGLLPNSQGSFDPSSFASKFGGGGSGAFGGIGNLMGNFMNAIPSNALSSFGLGSLFSI